MASPTDTSEGLLQRVESFVSDNRKAIIAGAAFVFAAGGVGYYLYASRNATKPTHDLEKAPEGKKKKKSKKKKVGADDGPILEERKPKSKPSATASEAASGKGRLRRPCFDSLTDLYLLS
jgi:import receptor subunit TOM70